MALDQQLLRVMVCPQCRGDLTPVDAEQMLLCNRCHLKYPVEHHIPVLVIAEAVDLKKQKRGASFDHLPKLSFRIVAGADSGNRFELGRGTCRVLARADMGPSKAATSNVDATLSLDQGAKSLAMAYIEKQFQRKVASSPNETLSAERLGSFQRVADLVLHDVGLSRLHAMLFCDQRGVGAILDLVSKNGTYVNNEEVESHLLKKGDVIEVGETKITFEG